VTGRRDDAGEGAGLLLEEAVDGQEVLADLRGAGPGARVLDELEGERFERVARLAAEQAPPPRHHSRGQAAEAQHVRPARRGEAPVAMARHGMADEVKQPREREEGLASHFAGAKGAVQLEGGKGRGRGG